MKKVKASTTVRKEQRECLWNWMTTFICSDYFHQLTELDKQEQFILFREMVDKDY